MATEHLVRQGFLTRIKTNWSIRRNDGISMKGSWALHDNRVDVDAFVPAVQRS